MAKVDIPEMDKTETTKPEKVGQIVSVKRKGSITKSLQNEFVKEEPNYVWDYVVHDILLPAAKVAISEVVTSVTDMFLFGEVRSRSSSRDRGGRYSTHSRDIRDRDDSRDRDDRRRYGHRMRYDDFSDIVFETRSDAVKVLEKMRDYIEDYDSVSVANFYDLVGEDSEFNDNDYGWTSLKNAYVEGGRGGWIIELPRAKHLGS